TAVIEVPVDRLNYVAEAGKTWDAQMVLPDGSTMDWAGEFIEVTPNSRLVLTITDRPAEPMRAQIVVELSEIAHGTRMRFTQETPGFTPEQQSVLIAGWQGFIDEPEKLAIESQEGSS